MSFLTGRFEPVSREVTQLDLEVRGTIPDWLNGRYVRNGPNPVCELLAENYNWFTGDGMVHGVRLSGRSRVSRWTRRSAGSRCRGRS